MKKAFKLRPEDIQEIVVGLGGCIASDMITVDGMPVLYMYRERPINPGDSGWRFLSGMESESYMADTEKHSVYDVNTIVNYDPAILPFLDAPIGAEFERQDTRAEFERI